MLKEVTEVEKRTFFLRPTTLVILLKEVVRVREEKRSKFEKIEVTLKVKELTTSWVDVKVKPVRDFVLA